LTSRTILRRIDVNVFYIFAAVSREFGITKLGLFAQADARYVLSTTSKVMNIKSFSLSLYISIKGYFRRLFEGQQDTTPNNTVEGLSFLISIQEVMGSNLGPECGSILNRFTISTHQFHTNTGMSP
jgi:hypothetical protein